MDTLQYIPILALESLVTSAFHVSKQCSVRCKYEKRFFVKTIVEMVIYTQAHPKMNKLTSTVHFSFRNSPTASRTICYQSPPQPEPSKQLSVCSENFLTCYFVG